MIEPPLVSVAIPCYNHERYVKECIQSVIDQDYDNIELIIIDDGSSDKSVEVIEEMIPACEKRFSRFTFRNRPNKGLSATLNEAIEWCKGTYFSAIASDDVMLPKKTSVLLQFIEEDKELAGVFCGCYILNDDGDRIGSMRPVKKTYSFEDIILRRHSISAPTQLLRLECLRQVGGYPENLYIEDWYMWLTLADKGFRLRVVDGLLVGYRNHSTNISKDALKMHEGRVRILQLFSGNRLYKKAMAQIYLVASLDFTSISKVKAAKLLFEGIGYNKSIIFSRWGGKCFLRLVIPRYMILWAKKWNSESPVKV